MKLPIQSVSVARNLRFGDKSRHQTLSRLVPAQAQTFARQTSGFDFESNQPEFRYKICETCDANGWRECTIYSNGQPIDISMEECLANCSTCQLIIPPLVPGQPLDPASLQYTRTCIQGGNEVTISCNRCSQETRFDLPWPASDRCIRVCCAGLDPSTCSVSARTC